MQLSRKQRRQLAREELKKEKVLRKAFGDTKMNDTMALIQNERRELAIEMSNSILNATLMVLHDKFGLDKSELDRFLKEYYNLFHSIQNEYLSLDDIKQTLKDELDLEV